MRTFGLALVVVGIVPVVQAQTDWPVYGHDPGGMRFSPLKQITPKNVSKLQVVWTFDTLAPITIASSAPAAGAGRAEAAAQAAANAAAVPAPEGGQPAGAPSQSPDRPAPPRPRTTESTPLVIGTTMFVGTPYNRVLALDAETGKKIWEYEGPHTPALRGISYWPGSADLPPQVVVTTTDGWLFTLNANTGKPIPGFGNEGFVNLRPGAADKFPNRYYGLSSPAAIYQDLIITGAHLQEQPALGPSGDIRAWDIHSGKLVWTFHTIPKPGEPNHEVWQDDQWVDRAGANSWGFITVDAKRGMLFVPLGTPTTDFWGGDRKGSNLYGSTLVALDAQTGKIKWYFQTTHHDNWDYDLTAPPALIEVRRNGQRIPAVAQSTKQGYVFIFDRVTGKPIYDVEERPVVAGDNQTPGDENWPTQPFPVKPPPIARNSFEPNEIATVTPEHEKYCRELLGMEGGAMTGGPFAQYGPKLRVVFPGWQGGGNWGGTSFDPHLGYLFVNIKNVANISKLVKTADGTSYRRVGPDNPSQSLGFDAYFSDPEKNWPCQQPPWGEFMAVNVDTGEIAWRVPLGSFEELDAKGVPKTGTPNLGGSIATAGGLVFIGATNDAKFRAFDSHTGKELWAAKLNTDAQTVPIAYRGKNGKEYVAIVSNGSAKGGSARVYVFALP